jgi:predicted dehydrogenase
MRVSIIGAGRMGRRHIHAAKKLGLDLVGVVDVSPASLEEARKEHGLNEILLFDEPEKLYAQVVPECLIIATTADSHCALTCVAAERGVKYILVEKPLAVSLAETDRMIRICAKYGALLSVNHQMRFMDQYSRPKALLNSDAYGGFKSMTVVGGNFGMSMNGTHYIEAFRYMADEDPAEVAAWFSPDVVANPRGSQFQDRAGSIRVVTASGKRLYMEIGSDQGHGLQVTYAGRNGMITINELTGDVTTSLRESQFRDLPTTRYGMPAEIGREAIAPAEVIDATARVLDALIKDENRVTALHGMMAVGVLVAAYSSAENGSVPVRLDGQLDRSRVFPWA